MEVLVERQSRSNAVRSPLPLVSDDEAKAVTWRLLRALSFLHAKRLLHRDVKLDSAWRRGFWCFLSRASLRCPSYPLLTPPSLPHARA